jgi:hypothetical protein
MKAVSLALALALWATTVPVGSQIRQNPPAAMSHFEGVNRRGDMAMGFDHSKTTHHFRLYEDGGAIGVEANDAADTVSRDAIRRHLRQIRTMFASGDFDLPMFIHATTPPGMKTLRRLKATIHYAYEDTARGAQVRLRTHNRKALAAIHRFLRFQIRDHRTGDPLTVRR